MGPFRADRFRSDNPIAPHRQDRARGESEGAMHAATEHGGKAAQRGELGLQHGERDGAEDGTADAPLARPILRLHHVDDEHHAIAIGVVPDRVAKRLVEREGLALPPAAALAADREPAVGPLARHDEPEMASIRRVGVAIVRRQRRMRLEQVDEGAGEVWDAAQDGHGVGEAGAVGGILVEVGDEVDAAPAAHLDGIGDVALGQLLAAPVVDLLEFGADGLPVALDLGEPGALLAAIEDRPGARVVAVDAEIEGFHGVSVSQPRSKIARWFAEAGLAPAAAASQR
jgi:hypothetical protein